MSNCPACGAPIKEVPAGVSKKTGKPYKAFQVCSNQSCGWKPQPGSVLVESHQPSRQPPAPNDFNEGKKENTITLARTDLMCALLKAYPGTANSNEIIAMHRAYWGEIVNPLGKV